jgi:predicted O-methyltransferase YrrM
MTTKEDILKIRPKSIIDLVNREFFIEVNEPNHESYILSGNYYENYYALSNFYQPESILEIGVRFGYSLGTMISASQKIKKVTGIDNDEYNKDSLGVAKENILKYINSDIDVNFLLLDSHHLSSLPYHDLIHVDGDHSYDGKIKDLKLTIGSCKVVIVDDYLHFSEVNKSTNDFISQNYEIINNTYVLDDHIRGTMIIEYK